MEQYKTAKKCLPLRLKAFLTMVDENQSIKLCQTWKEENDNLASFQWYSKINCLLDCKIKIAEEMCGCSPWDYPNTEQENDIESTKTGRICDFFGNSCFNKVLRQDITHDCDKNCVPSCNKISYSIDISNKPIDPKRRICSLVVKPKNNLESNIRKYIGSLYDNENRERYANSFLGPPELRIMNLISGMLSANNDTEPENITETFGFKGDCNEKLENDIAVVVVSIDSPTFTRTTKHLKATILDKVAYIGKKN